MVSVIGVAAGGLFNAVAFAGASWHTAKPGPDPDSDPYKTRTREKPGLDTRTYLRKKPDLSPQNPDSINKKN